jgi:ABC-type transporter MlaC component
MLQLQLARAPNEAVLEDIRGQEVARKVAQVRTKEEEVEVEVEVGGKDGIFYSFTNTDNAFIQISI